MSVRLANIKFSGLNKLISFEISITNIGRSAFREPSVNINGLMQDCVQTEFGQWSPERNRIIYDHHKSLISGVSLRAHIRIIDSGQLPPNIDVALLHFDGIDKCTIDISDLINK